MDSFSVIGNGWDFVLGRRSAWLELSNPRYPYWCLIRFAGSSLRGVLYYCLAVPCACPWILVGNDMGICDRRCGIAAVWSSVPPHLPNAFDFLRVGRIGRACCFRDCLRNDTRLWSLSSWSATSIGHRD